MRTKKLVKNHRPPVLASKMHTLGDENSDRRRTIVQNYDLVQVNISQATILYVCGQHKMKTRLATMLL